MPRVAVAGASGFIGSHVVERLCVSGHEVVAVDRPGADFSVARAAGACAVGVDLADGRAAAEALHGAGYVVNATGLFDLAATSERLIAVNVGVTRAVVRAARAAGGAA
jgi:nucleoside-diphosphate-sugar epimerase